MRFTAILGAVVLAGCATAGRTAEPSRAELFRTVQFDPYSPITLGEALRAGSPPTSIRGDMLALADLQFGGTDTIYVQLSSDGRVRAMHFVYPHAEFGERLGGYEEALGAPQLNTEADSATGKVRHVVWEDSATKFILGHYVSASGGQRVSSSLIDKK